MLAITTTDVLATLDPVVLKKPPSSIPSCLELIHTPTASSWSTDNSFLYLASDQVIHRYDPTLNSLSDIFSQAAGYTITNLVSKGKSTLIFSSGERIHVLDSIGSSPQVSQTFDSHKSAITSLSISNDSTLLASTSAAAVHVHNISLGSHTVLRGLALAGQTITICSFHPHSRTRLLVGAGTQFMVYDTTRPSSPLKSISLGDVSSGEIVGISSSTFSKTLVAVATSGGQVCLIELDKDKGLFRTINIKVPLTSISFSPDGTSICLGTENGKLLIVSLRALNDSPKAVIISESGSRIETITIQKKIKAGSDSVMKPSGKAIKTESDGSAPTLRRTGITAAKSSTKVALSPARTRTTRPTIAASPSIRKVPSGKEPLRSPTKAPSRASDEKKAFSPVRDPLGNSQSIEDISIQLDNITVTKSLSNNVKATPAKKSGRVSSTPSRPKPSPSSRTPDHHPKIQDRGTAKSTVSRTRTTSTNAPPDSASAVLSIPSGVEGEPEKQKRTVFSAPRAAESISAVRTTRTTSSASSRTASSSSRTITSASSRARSSSATSVSIRTVSSASCARSSSPVPPVPPLPSSLAAMGSRTPSPTLSDPNQDPITPVPAQKRKGMVALGVSTPDVDAWIRAGEGEESHGHRNKGKGKAVGFQDSEESDSDHPVENARPQERVRELSMQISPRRSGSSAQSPAPDWSNSPVRHMNSPRPSAGLSAGGAQDLLRNIVKDVMYDFQRESKEEMMGMHLDLVKMGISWKKELRSLMDEYVGDLRDLREENQRLRDENERLRRGHL
ncbi:WD40-repeat-containing domain protein [Cyathus striatus]|nr:WD40-repeat-containing domain protein [Cyathus striatus]